MHHHHPDLVHRLVADRQAAFRRQARAARLNRATARATLDRQRTTSPPRVHRHRG